MTQYIGQITVILENDTPQSASETLCLLAKQLDETCDEVIFADHNGDVEDYEQIERECNNSKDIPLLEILLTSLRKCANFLAYYEEYSAEASTAYREAIAAIAKATPA